MISSVLTTLGNQIRHQRHIARMSQSELGARVGRNGVRISEFERDLLNNRWGRDRLTLLVEICDALALDIVLLPRARARELEAWRRDPSSPEPTGDVSSSFDDLFVDLGDDQEKG